MFAYLAEEMSIQSMIDEYLEANAEKIDPESKLHFGVDDFQSVGYVVYWVEQDRYLTPLKDNNSCLFHGLPSWAKLYESQSDATGIAMLLLNTGVILNSGLKVLKAISNEAAVTAANNQKKTTAIKKRKFTGVDDSHKFVMILSPVWSNYPFDGSREENFDLA